MAFHVDQFMNVPEDEIETDAAKATEATKIANIVEIEDAEKTSDVGTSASDKDQGTETGDPPEPTAPVQHSETQAPVAQVDNSPAETPSQMEHPAPTPSLKVDASIQHEPLPGASVYAFSERIEQGFGEATLGGVEEGPLDATMEAPPISMAVKQSMESDLAPPPAPLEAPPITDSGGGEKDPYARPDLQLSMAALQQAANLLQSSTSQADSASRNAIHDASQALQNVALLQSMVRLLPTEGMKLKHGRPSRFKGITPHHGRWQARIKEARRDIHLGYFNTEEAAARAYDRAVLKFRGNEGLTNLCAADYEEPPTVSTPTDIPGKVDAATMTPIDCAESKGARPLPAGYSPANDDLPPGMVRCPKCGKPKSGDGTQAPVPAAQPPPQAIEAPPSQVSRANMQLALTPTPPSALPSPTALVSQAGLSSTLEAYQSVLGSFGTQTVAEFWSAAAAALSPQNGLGIPSPRENGQPVQMQGQQAGEAQGLAAASPTTNGVPAQASSTQQVAPPLLNLTRPRPEAIQNVLVHPVTSLATLAAMDALVLREAGIDPEVFFNTQKRRALRRTSNYRGITRHHGRWQARIKDQRRDIHLGYFDTEIAAARAYDQAALRYRGTKAQLNFPETDYPPELKMEGERRVAAGALQDVEDPIIAQKRKELLGTLRAERAQAKRQKVMAQGGVKKGRRAMAGNGQLEEGGWQQAGQEGVSVGQDVLSQGGLLGSLDGPSPLPVAQGTNQAQAGLHIEQALQASELPEAIPLEAAAMEAAQRPDEPWAPGVQASEAPNVQLTETLDP